MFYILIRSSPVPFVWLSKDFMLPGSRRARGVHQLQVFLTVVLSDHVITTWSTKLHACKSLIKSVREPLKPYFFLFHRFQFKTCLGYPLFSYCSRLLWCCLLHCNGRRLTRRVVRSSFPMETSPSRSRPSWTWPMEWATSTPMIVSWCCSIIQNCMLST